MKILLTGYPGWFSSRFLATLSAYEHRIRSVRCLVRRQDAGVVTRADDFEFAFGDLLDRESLERACRGQDAVVHAAGIIHARRIRDLFTVNRDGTRSLLEACEAEGVPRFIHISSNAAQGFSEKGGRPLLEDDLCRPESPYGKSKREGEIAVGQFESRGKIASVILRPAMFYGPHVPARHIAVYRLIERGFFPVFGDGLCRRSMTFIDHLVQAVHLALRHDEIRGRTFTIVDRSIPTLRELVSAMAEALGRRVRFVSLPEAFARAACVADQWASRAGYYWMAAHLIGESHRSVAFSCDRAVGELGYRPETPWREGIRRAIVWCRENGWLARPGIR